VITLINALPGAWNDSLRLYISNVGADRSDRRINWSAHEVLEAKGITIDDIEDMIDRLKGKSND